MVNDKAPVSSTAPASLDHSISKKLTDLVHPLHKFNWDKCSTSSSFIGNIKSAKVKDSNGNVTVSSSNGTGGFFISGDNIRTQLEENLKQFERKLDPSQITIIKTINDLLAQKLDDLITHNMQVLMVGAALGAAISAGVLIGIGTASATTSIVSSSYTTTSSSRNSSNSHSWGLNIYRRWRTWIRRILPIPYSYGSDTEGSKEKDNGNMGGQDKHTYTHADIDMDMDMDMDMNMDMEMDMDAKAQSQRVNALCILQASPSKTLVSTSTPASASASASASSTPPEDQCRQCLNSLTVSLGKRRLLWDDVLKITAYLVIHQCEARTFRNVLKEFPICVMKQEDGASGNYDGGVYTHVPSCSIAIVYVQQLEDANISVQLEALVQNNVRVR